MAQSAELKLDGKKSDLRYINYRFHRGSEETGKPSTRVKRGEITITKDSLYDKGSFTTWMSDPDMAKDGEIIIYNDEKKDKPMKTIKWTNGFIIAYEETFSHETAAANTLETFTISAEKIEIDSSKFDFVWPKES